MQKTDDRSPDSERCIAVVDEAGNRYEATWKRRAQGLVKNGRARYIDESTICLTCPPKNITKNSEDKNMSNKLNKNQVFNQIADLQKSLESIDKILFKVQCVNDTQGYVENEDSPIILEYSADVAKTKVDVIREIAMSRENTIRKMLDFYLSVYKELENTENK